MASISGQDEAATVPTVNGWHIIPTSPIGGSCILELSSFDRRMCGNKLSSRYCERQN